MLAQEGCADCGSRVYLCSHVSSLFLCVMWYFMLQAALEAMGFYDASLNLSLLAKHQGSIEAVVIDLSS